jgi:hypothetical protein
VIRPPRNPCSGSLQKAASAAIVALAVSFWRPDVAKNQPKGDIGGMTGFCGWAKYPERTEFEQPRKLTVFCAFDAGFPCFGKSFGESAMFGLQIANLVSL